MAAFDQNVLDGIKILAKINPKFTSIIEASPYDHRRNLDAELDEELFYSTLFIKPPSYDRLVKELRNNIDSKYDDKNVVLISGYSGVGKSTFIHYYQKMNPAYDYDYVNYDRIVEIEKYKDPTRIGLIYYMINNYNKEDFTNAFIHLAVYTNKYIGYASEDLLDFANDINLSVQYTDVERASFIIDLKLTDALLLFILIKLLKHKEGEKHIIFFDNLDVLKLEYVSIPFLNDFYIFLHNISLRAQDSNLFGSKVHFSTDFRFVFCMRDANDAMISQHIKDSYGWARGVSRMRFNVEHSFTYNVLKRRFDIISFLRENYDYYSKDEIIATSCNIIETLFDDNYRYFDHAIIRLYNYDLKKLTFALFKILESKQTRCFFKDLKGRKYILGGGLVFWFIDLLRKYSRIDSVIELPPANKDDGYCEHGRMILNFILNKGGCQYRYDIGLQADDNKCCTLYDVIDGFKDIYPVDEILKVVARLFLTFGKDSWVNLITIYNRKVDNDDVFIRDCPGIVNGAVIPNVVLKEKFNDVQLKINPSGYSLLKYILIHFEYYANQLEVKESSKHKPLFMYGTDKSDDGKYEFENRIKEVIGRVGSHIDSQNKFFKKQFQEKNNIGPRDYETSDYAFKYFEEAKDPSGVGSFHSQRIISSQLRYIDNFRLNIITDNMIDKTKKIEINNILIELIIKYIDILNKSHDYRAGKIAKELLDNISLIKTDIENKFTLPIVTSKDDIL